MTTGLIKHIKTVNLKDRERNIHYLFNELQAHLEDYLNEESTINEGMRNALIEPVANRIDSLHHTYTDAMVRFIRE